MRDLKILHWLLVAVFVFAFNSLGETHSSGKEKQPQSRPEAESSEKPETKLFDTSPGDLDESERKEVEAMRQEVVSAVEEENNTKGRMGQILDWDKKQDKIQKILKKLQNKLDRENARSDSQVAKKELQSLLEVVQEKKKRAWRRWVNPFAQ